MFDEQNRYVIRDYRSRPPFSSFLPGVAGPEGIPAWVYYNNRGQGVCSFGADDKEHSVLEFCPAHTAYQNNDRTGFRTFLRLDGAYCEAFTGACDMHIGAGELAVTWQGGGVEAEAVYFVLPGERAAGLVRLVTVRSVCARALDVELLDGLPAIVPYGMNNDRLKNLTQLSKAWMLTEDRQTGLPWFRLRASMEDSARVTPVSGGSFGLAMDETGALLQPVVDPELVFGQDTGLARAHGFAAAGAGLAGQPQAEQNVFPCCFFPARRTLEPGGTLRLCCLYGQTQDKKILRSLAARIRSQDWFDERRREALRLAEELTRPIRTRTASPVFDAYCRQTYLDNLLRGGTPVFFRDGEKKTPFYLYSRKHGDPEREYNAFSLGREYYAQGNGNFRDVCQNRRSDVLFCPELEDAAIRPFFELIQSDGYNPLVLTVCTFRLDREEAERQALALPEEKRREAVRLLTGDWTPGRLAMFAEDCGLIKDERAAFTARCVCRAEGEPNADFSEGYWCDHWTYSLDLVERYLAVWPEKKQALLFGGETLRWYETRTFLRPRAERYVMTENGLRQYRFLDPARKTGAGRKWMQTASGETARSSLAEKLAVLGALKTAALDPAGMGVEMEGGRPGWYDALNGLPGLLGSSVAETCELARLLAFTAEALERQPGEVFFFEEMRALILAVDAALRENSDPWARWDAANRAKEAYREKTAEGVTGRRQGISCRELAAMLRRFERAALEGIGRAENLTGGIVPTYFTFTAEDAQDGCVPRRLTPHALPLFLEGPVRWLKLGWPEEEKRALAERLRESGLYDRKLAMYKVNESLENVSFEVGRAKAFTPGWLENESIWLHMEYKYLLELLKSGLCGEFSQAFRDAAVPFLSPEVYGRSPLENVSFIASSANPDPRLHGRGFVARMTGAAAEFVDIWQRLFFGPAPFRLENGRLALRLEPFIPAYLMPEDGRPEATLLGRTLVRYEAQGHGELVPGRYAVKGFRLARPDGAERYCPGGSLPEDAARLVRAGEISAITVEIT